MTRAPCALLALLLLCGCGESALPAPSILAVAPRWVPEGQPAVLSVRVSALPLFSVDYEEQAVEHPPLTPRLWIAGQEVEITFIEDDGTLVAQVPEELALGAHEVRVVLEDGREAVREQAFSVVPAATIGEEQSGGREGVRVGLTGFAIEPVGEQVRGVPFQLTVRALGPGASSYAEPIWLRSNKGKLSTVAPGAFRGGVRVEELSVDSPSAGIYLLVEDAHGNKGLSNAFRVRPH